MGHYRLTARLGSGGMGVVYLGVSWDGAPVAVKVLRRELAGDEEFRRRFGREVAALVQVKGVCTVRVIEADSQSATPFVVTEYAQGPSLSEYIDKHGSVAPDMLFGLATGLAEALTTIHAAGIMHRDLKPSNIILTDAGPKVIDFGIARRQDTTAVTRTGMMIGSMGFMAPEQISGHPGPEADIFAWGDGRVRGRRSVAVRRREHPFRPVPDHVRRRRHRLGPRLAPPAGGSHPGQGPAGPPVRAAIAGPADERFRPNRERRRHHAGDPGADLAERIPREPASRQAGPRESGPAGPARGVLGLAACGAAHRPTARRRAAGHRPTDPRHTYRRPA